MEYVIGLAAVVLFVIILLYRRKEHLEEMHQIFTHKHTVQKNIKEVTNETGKEIKKTHNILHAEIEEHFSGHSNQKLLLDVLDEWLDLKKKALKEHRSWLRKKWDHLGH